VAWVRECTIPTERQSLVGEVSAKFCGYRVPRGQREESLRPYSWFLRPEPLPDPVPDPLLLRKSGSAWNRIYSIYTKFQGDVCIMYRSKSYRCTIINLEFCPVSICRVFQKELYNDIPNVAVWRALRKRWIVCKPHSNIYNTIVKLFLKHPALPVKAILNCSCCQ
jgi:hypothetical protein